MICMLAVYSQSSTKTVMEQKQINSIWKMNQKIIASLTYFHLNKAGWHTGT